MERDVAAAPGLGQLRRGVAQVAAGGGRVVSRLFRADTGVQDRTAGFGKLENNRYWWFSVTGDRYTPALFEWLTDDEWAIMKSWYIDSEKHYAAGTGECNIPPMSFLMGLITGNDICRIVQCGHFIGFSTLLLGFMMRRMRRKHSLFSIDIDTSVTEYTRRW